MNTARIDRVAVITGASSGIGAASAVGLAAAGYRVVLTARRRDRLEQVASKIAADGGSAEVHQLDVTDRAAVDALAAVLPRCDVLVANAGGAIGAETVANSSAADWQAMYDVNVLGTLHATQALLPMLIATGAGTIVLMGSTAGLISYARDRRNPPAGAVRPACPRRRDRPRHGQDRRVRGEQVPRRRRQGGRRVRGRR
jgi:NADP-dependent 3-hydroxy acid dehydrogenase YdfG